MLDLGERQIRAKQVVVATGPFQAPRMPALALAQLAPDVFQIHSSEYHRPSDIPAGTVLVVGGGNTGYQIAKELTATHRVHLAVGSRQTPLPQRLLGRDVFWWLTKLGLLEKTVDSRIGRRARDRDTLIGSNPRQIAPPRRAVTTTGGQRRGAHDHLRGRQHAQAERGDLGDRLPARPLLDQAPRLRPTTAPPGTGAA